MSKMRFITRFYQWYAYNLYSPMKCIIEMLTRRFITRFNQWYVFIIYIHLRIIEMSRIRFIAWFYLSNIVVHTKYILFYNVHVEKIKPLFFLQHYVSVHTSNNRFELKGHGHLMCAPKSSLGTNYKLDLINLKRGDQFQPAPSKPKLIRV